jgi:hypothetical protein
VVPSSFGTLSHGDIAHVWWRELQLQLQLHKEEERIWGSISFGLGDVLVEANHSSALARVSCSCIVGYLLVVC